VVGSRVRPGGERAQRLCFKTGVDSSHPSFRRLNPYPAPCAICDDVIVRPFLTSTVTCFRSDPSVDAPSDLVIISQGDNYDGYISVTCAEN